MLGIGLFIPAAIAVAADKNDSSQVPEFMLVLAIVVLLMGFLRAAVSPRKNER